MMSFIGQGMVLSLFCMALRPFTAWKTRSFEFFITFRLFSILSRDSGHSSADDIQLLASSIIFLASSLFGFK